MENIGYKFIFALLFLFLLVGTVHAQPSNVFGNFLDGYTIENPNADYIPINNNLSFNVHVFNSSNGVIIDGSFTSCTMDLYDNLGNHKIDGYNLLYSPTDFGADILSGNFTTTGIYAYMISCNSSIQGGFLEGHFIVNNIGEEPTVPKAIFYVGLFFALMMISILVFIAHLGDKAFIWKFWWFTILWLLMIGVTFTAWRMSQDFFTSQQFLIWFFYIIFWVLLSLFVPFLLAMIIWTFFMVFVWLIYILPLTERGLSLNEAWREVGNRNKGKLFGKLLNLADLFSSGGDK